MERIYRAVQQYIQRCDPGLYCLLRGFNQSRVATSTKSGRWITVLHSNTSAVDSRNNRSNMTLKEAQKTAKSPLSTRKGNILGGERWSMSARHWPSRTLPKLQQRQQTKTHKANFKSLKITRIFYHIWVMSGIGTYLPELLNSGPDC